MHWDGVSFASLAQVEVRTVRMHALEDKTSAPDHDKTQPAHLEPNANDWIITGYQVISGLEETRK